MNVNLREAGRIRRDLESWIARNTPEARVKISVHDPEIGDTLDLRRQEVMDDVELYDEALRALYGLRARIGKANAADSDVDLYLAQKNLCERQVRFLSELVDEAPKGRDVLVAEIEASRESALSDYGHGGYFGSEEKNVNVLRNEDIGLLESRLKESRRDLRKAEMALLNANMNNEVELEGHWVDLFENIGVI